MARSSNLNEDGRASGDEDVSIPDEAYLTTSDSEDNESYGEPLITSFPEEGTAGPAVFSINWP